MGGTGGPLPGWGWKWKPEHYAAAAQAGYSRRAISQLKMARARQGGQAWAERNVRRVSAVGSALGAATSTALGLAPPAGWESLVHTGAGWSFSCTATCLAVVLEQPSCQVGDVLAGAVALHLTAPLPSAGLYLKVGGGLCSGPLALRPYCAPAGYWAGHSQAGHEAPQACTGPLPCR